MLSRAPKGFGRPRGVAVVEWNRFSHTNLLQSEHQLGDEARGDVPEKELNQQPQSDAQNEDFQCKLALLLRLTVA